MKSKKQTTPARTRRACDAVQSKRQWEHLWRAARRRDRAEFEQYQQDWFAKQLRISEAGLQALGLPSTSWHGVQLRFDDDDDVPLQKIGVGIQSGPIVWTSAAGEERVGDWPGEKLYRFVADNPRGERAWEALRKATTARAVATAMHSDWPTARFVLGRFIENVRLADPKTRKRIVDDFLHAPRAKGARKATAVRKSDADKRAKLLVAEYDSRRKAGEKSGDIINSMSERPGGFSKDHLRTLIKPRSRGN